MIPMTACIFREGVPRGGVGFADLVAVFDLGAECAGQRGGRTSVLPVGGVPLGARASPGCLKGQPHALNPRINPGLCALRFTDQSVPSVFVNTNAASL